MTRLTGVVRRQGRAMIAVALVGAGLAALVQVAAPAVALLALLGHSIAS